MREPIYTDFRRPLQSAFAHVQSVTAKFETVYMLDCKMSCEPRRTSAYSEDLRWHMVWQKEVLGLSYKEIGNHLNVDPSTVAGHVISSSKLVLYVRGSIPEGENSES